MYKIKERIKGKLKENCGEMGFTALIAFLVVMLIFSFAFETSQRYITAGCVKQSMYNALISNGEDNFDAIYSCMRESGEGAYEADGTGNWIDAGNMDSVYKELADVTGGEYDDGSNKIVVNDKYGNALYVIKDIKLQIINPSVTSGTNSSIYYEKATFTLAMPFFVAGDKLPNITVPMKVTVKYTPKF